MAPKPRPQPIPPPADDRGRGRPDPDPADDRDDQQIGIIPGRIPTDDPRDPRFPGSQPDIA